MALNIEVTLNGLTWGELRKFVALGSQMDDSDDVYVTQNQDDLSFESLMLLDVDLEDRPCP